jgi:hypothetical protein
MGVVEERAHTSAASCEMHEPVRWGDYAGAGVVRAAYTRARRMRAAMM